MADSPENIGTLSAFFEDMCTCAWVAGLMVVSDGAPCVIVPRIRSAYLLVLPMCPRPAPPINLLLTCVCLPRIVHLNLLCLHHLRVTTCTHRMRGTSQTEKAASAPWSHETPETAGLIDRRNREGYVERGVSGPGTLQYNFPVCEPAERRNSGGAPSHFGWRTSG